MKIKKNNFIINHLLTDSQLEDRIGIILNEIFFELSSESTIIVDNGLNDTEVCSVSLININGNEIIVSVELNSRCPDYEDDDVFSVDHKADISLLCETSGAVREISIIPDSEELLI